MTYSVKTKQRKSRDPLVPPQVVAEITVGTLDEARDVIEDAVGVQLYPPLKAESGGTVGPLPDGTVIEVRPA